MTENATAKRMLKRKEYADRLGVSIPTIERWEKAGYGPMPIRIKRAVRYNAEEVDAFVSSLTQRAS